MDFIYLLLGRVMRACCAGYVLHKKSLAGIYLVNTVQIFNRFIGHARNQVPSRLAVKGVNLRRVAIEVRLPLVRITTDETVKVLEAQTGRPPVERSNLASDECGVLWSLPNHEVA